MVKDSLGKCKYGLISKHMLDYPTIQPPIILFIWTMNNYGFSINKKGTIRMNLEITTKYITIKFDDWDYAFYLAARMVKKIKSNFDFSKYQVEIKSWVVYNTPENFQYVNECKVKSDLLEERYIRHNSRGSYSKKPSYSNLHKRIKKFRR
jgi:hypothetical protein